MDRATPDTTTTSSSSMTASFDEEWEEWDGNSPFWVHCVAGSAAGVAEHVLVYPLDTVRTHIQVCAACQFNPATHNASTQAASMAAKTATPNATANIPGAVLQQAASAAAPKVTKSKAKTVRTPKLAAAAASSARGGGGSIVGPGTPNLSMMQAVRQLVSQQPLALETTTTVAAATSSTSSSAASNALTTAASSELGMTRLWRGVQTILVGCIPAHALYFSTYELVKAATLDERGDVTAYGSALAGGAAVVSHDMILGPLDTVKQRLQLGHYKGLTDALNQMIRNEGAVSLLRSFPITLATNIPYGMIMVGTNEALKDQWTKIQSDHDSEHPQHSELTLGVTLGASSVAGLVAAATTTPLDRIKTYLQTQQLAPSCLMKDTRSSNAHCPYGGRPPKAPIVADWRQAAQRIYQQEGPAGFFRGVTPRILSHTPAVAISWTTYETFKRYLLQPQQFWNDE